MSVKIITPYVSEQSIQEHKQLFWGYDVYYEQDVGGIGADLMFQKMWSKFPKDDIFILHADMYPAEEQWLDRVLDYVKLYPEAGMFGCLLLYPLRNDAGKYYIQSAGGQFTNGRPDHYGSGIILETGQTFKEHLEVDEGQYNTVREVAWTTFGGCYIRRSMINSVGGFSPEYEWAYNRDVDFCLTARQKGHKIYQIPVKLIHSESRDGKIAKMQDPTKAAMEQRNLVKLKAKWEHTEFYRTIDRKIKDI